MDNNPTQNSPSELGGNVTKPTSPENNRIIDIKQAAKILNISEADVQDLVKREALHEVAPGKFIFSEVAREAVAGGLTLSEEAAQVGIGLQSALAAALNVMRVIVTTAFAGAVVYGLTVAGVAVAYAYNPAGVANWITQKNPSPIQALLQAPGATALSILKYTEPNVYKTVAQNQVLNVNDYFTVSKYGTISPTEPVVFPASSYFQVVTASLIKNLNAEFLQGKVPGTLGGDLAIIGQVTGLADNSVSTNDIQDQAVTGTKIADNTIGDSQISGITASGKVSGSAVQLNGNGGLTDNSGLSLLTSCSDTQVLEWNGSTSAWECASATSGSSGITAIREGGSTKVSSATAINFDATDFNVTESPTGVGNITIDYANSGITKSGSTESITGDWTFTNLSSTGNLSTQKGADYGTIGSQNNVNLGSGSLFRYTGNSPATFTGISGGTNGRIIEILNTGSSTLTLSNQSGSSGAGNKIATQTGSDITISSNSAVGLQYDSGDSVWRVISTPVNSAALGNTVFLQNGNGFGATAVLGTTDANALNLITSGSTRFTLDSAAPTLTGQGATTLGSTGTLTLSSGTASGITINTGTTGAINIGSDSDTETVNLGTGAGVKAVTLGSLTSTSTTTILSGTSGILIGDRAVNKQINIGGNIFDAADTVKIATNATSADTITIGNANAATTLALTGGTSWSISSGGVLTVVGGASPDITSTSGNSLTVDSGGAGALNLGTGSTAKTIALGGSGANTVNIANTQTGGSLNLGAAMTTGTITIGGTGAQTGTIGIGTGTGTQEIDFGTGAGVKTNVLGSSTTTSATNINSGTGNVNFTVGPTSSSSKVVIGTSASSTPDTLVLDTGTADPTGGSATNGASYYNTSTDKFRCYEGGAWKDCDTTGGTTTLQTAYNAGQTITLSTGKPLSITGGDATDTVGITPSSAALTLTSGAAATWGTSTGNLTLQVAGTGTTANVQIGAGGSTTPDLLVVDKDTTSLPAGTNGAIVQDSSGKFEIYESGQWKILCNQFDQACGNGSGSALSALTSATTGNTLTNADNAQVWNWKLTTSGNTAFKFGETSASTAGGTPYILGISTLATSTANPLLVTAQGTSNGVKVDTSGALTAIGTGSINATLLNGATFAAPGTIGGTTPGAATFTNITDNGLSVSSGVYTDASKILTSTPPTSGVLGYFSRSGTTLSPSNAGDAITTSGNISTSGSGTITSAGTLVASNGFTLTTGALSFAATSGTLSATGLTALTETLSSGTAAITAPTLNLNTSSTGTVGIGNGTGVVTFNSPTINLAGNSTIIDMTGSGTLGLNSTSNAPITTGTGLLTATGGLTTGASGNFSNLKGADYSTTGVQDNVSLGGGAGALFRYTGAGTATFSGIANGANGRIIRIMNVSASNLTIKNNGSGTAANNVTTQTGSDIVLTQNETVTLQYDSGASVWRVMALPANATTLAGFAYVQGGNAFGATANLGTTDANIMNLITGGNTRFTVANDVGSSTFTGTSTTTFTSTGTTTLSSAAASALTIDSGTTGAINIGNSANAKTINLGTGAAVVETINIGGTGDNVIGLGNTQAGGSINLGGAMTTGTISIGGGTQTGTLSIGTGSGVETLNFGTGGTGAKTVTLGSTASTSSLTLDSGTGTIAIGTGGQARTVNIGTGGAAQTVTIGSQNTTSALTLDSGTGTIAIGTGAQARTINIGTGGAAQTVTLGSTSGGGSTSIASGTGGISIGTAAVAKSINIGTGGAVQTVTVGSTNTSSSLTLNAGSGGFTMAPGGLGAASSGHVPVCVNSATGVLFLGGTQSQCNTSSERFKYDIQDIGLGLDAVMAMRPVSYIYKETNIPALGFIAEDAAKIDERLIVRDSQGLPFAINPEAFTPIIAKGLQQLDQQVNGIAVIVNGSATGVTSLNGTVTSLQDQINEIKASYTVAITANNQTLLSQVTDMINAIYTNVAEFFGSVIFHSDVAFLGRPTFNKDTAGFASVTAGQNEVDVNFDKEYANLPVVTASVNLVGGVSANQVPSYAVYDISTKGFKIKLSQSAPFDMQFSWISLAVANSTTSQGQVSGAATTAPISTPVPTDTATPVASPTDTPVATPTPTAVPTSTPTDTPAPTSTATP